MPYKVMAVLPGNPEPVAVDVAELPDDTLKAIIKEKGLMPADTFEAELARRAEAIAKNKGLRSADDFLGDEAFAARFIEKNGLVKPGTPAGDADGKAAEQIAARLKTERATWESTHLQPAVKRAETAEQKNDHLVRRGLQKEILMAAQPYVNPPLLAKSGPKKVAPIVAMYEDNFIYDPQTDEYYVKEGDGFAFSLRGDKTQPYMTIEEWFEVWAADKATAAIVNGQRQTGPDLKGKTTDRGGRADPNEYLTRDQAGDASVYQAAKKRAAERGGRVVITDLPAA